MNDSMLTQAEGYSRMRNRERERDRQRGWNRKRGMGWIIDDINFLTDQNWGNWRIETPVYTTENQISAITIIIQMNKLDVNPDIFV